MAAEITASSMGESIGLGYRTKDIGPQLMQFQASELARRSAEKNAEKKEKKADYDKALDKIFNLGNTDVHKVFRKEMNGLADDAKVKVTKANNEGDTEGITNAIFDFTRAVSDYKDKTTNLRKVETAASSKSELVPNDIISSFSGDKFVAVPDESQEYMLSLGWEVDPINRMFTNKAGFKPKDSLNEIMTSPMPTKDVLLANGSKAEFKKDPTQPGFSISGADVYKPTPQYWDAVVNAKLQDPEFVANELMRITRNNDGQSYAKLAAEKRAAMAGPGGDPSTIAIIDVNRAIVKENLDNTVRDTWINNHTIRDDKNVKPVSVSSGNNNNKDPKPNSADIHTFTHIPTADRAQIIAAAKRNNRYPGIEYMTDEAIANIVTADALSTFGTFGAKAIKNKRNSFGVIISSTTETVALPSFASKPVALSGLYYDKSKGKLYATGNTQIVVSNSVPATDQFVQFEVSKADLRAIRSASVSNKGLKEAIAQFDLNAASKGYPTTDGILKDQTSTPPKKISNAEWNRLFKLSQAQPGNSNLTEAQFATWMLDNNNMTH
jgi:hypothetical protein